MGTVARYSYVLVPGMYGPSTPVAVPVHGLEGIDSSTTSDAGNESVTNRN